MEIVEEYTEVHKRVKRYCDNCGKELHWTLACSKMECSACGKQLCPDCVGYEVEHGGDWHYVYCKSCCQVYEKYKDRRKKLQEESGKLWNDFINEANDKRVDFKRK